MNYIYILIDPRNNNIRYVGKTTNISFRISKHISDSKRSTRTKVKAWIKSLLKAGEMPIIQEIDCVSDFQYWERFYISYFKFIGCDLLNMTEGGENPPVLFGKDNPMKRKDIAKKISASKNSIIRPIFQFTKTGDFVKKWVNISEILNMNPSYDKRKVQRCCSEFDNAIYAYGYAWSYNSNWAPKHIIKGKQVIDLSTGFFFDSAKEASIAFNISHSALVKRLNGTTKNTTNLKYA